MLIFRCREETPGTGGVSVGCEPETRREQEALVKVS